MDAIFNLGKENFLVILSLSKCCLHVSIRITLKVPNIFTHSFFSSSSSISSLLLHSSSSLSISSTIHSSIVFYVCSSSQEDKIRSPFRFFCGLQFSSCWIYPSSLRLLSCLSL
uniref:Uncharacterized protein n=1 Tax=Cacopsylla melanoneura TaxID=428564 RepID=A0A8D9B978_9HEMI